MIIHRFVEAKAKKNRWKRSSVASLFKEIWTDHVIALIVMMAFVILLATIELGWLIIKDMITHPTCYSKLMSYLIFLVVFAGLARNWVDLDTTNLFTENEVHVEVVFVVALIAIGRRSSFWMWRTLKFDVDWHCLVIIAFLWDTSLLKKYSEEWAPWETKGKSRQLKSEEVIQEVWKPRKTFSYNPEEEVNTNPPLEFISSQGNKRPPATRRIARNSKPIRQK